MKQLYKKAVVYTNKSGLPLDIVEVKEFECKKYLYRKSKIARTRQNKRARVER